MKASFEMPSLETLLDDDRERNKLIAFAATKYEQHLVLFLLDASVFKATTKDNAKRAQRAANIVKEYFAEDAAHPLECVSDAQRKQVVKDCRKKNTDAKVFDGAITTVSESLKSSLLPLYSKVWLKEKKIDQSRRQLLAQVQFDIFSPPPLPELMADAKSRAQLQEFSASLFCEEILMGYSAMFLYEQSPTREAMQEVIDKYVEENGEHSLNLTWDQRTQTIEACKKKLADPAAALGKEFLEVMGALIEQTHMNVLEPFLEHLKSIRKEVDVENSIAKVKIAMEESMKEGMTHDSNSSSNSNSNSGDKSDGTSDVGEDVVDRVVEEWRKSFRAPSFAEVMQNPDLRWELLSFAGTLYCQERVVFVFMCREWRSCPDEELRFSLGEELMNVYVREGSLRQVTMEGRRQRRLVEQWDEWIEKCKTNGDRRATLDEKMFDAAMKEVERSIEHELYERFVQHLRQNWQDRILVAVEEEEAKKNASSKTLQDSGDRRSSGPNRLLKKILTLSQRKKK